MALTEGPRTPPSVTETPGLMGRLRSIPPKLWLRFAILVAIAVFGLLLLRWPPVASRLTQENVTAVLGTLRGQWWSPLLLLGVYAVVGPLGLPVSPVMVAGGAVFGAAAGALYNTAGLFLAAALSFVVARSLGRDLVVHVAGDRLRRVEHIVSRRGFWPLVQIRFFPLPFSIVNYGAALAGVPAPLFLIATAIGLAPATLMHTYFAARLATAPDDGRSAVILGWVLLWAGMAIASGLPTVRDGLRRRARYRELIARRRDR